MSNTEYIEKTIIVSVLVSDSVGADRRIRETELDPELFTNSFHKLIVRAIERMKKKDLPLDFELLQQKMEKAEYWGMQHDAALLEIMTHRAFGTYKTFAQYYKLLEKNKMNSFDLEVAI